MYSKPASWSSFYTVFQSLGTWGTHKKEGEECLGPLLNHSSHLPVLDTHTSFTHSLAKTIMWVNPNTWDRSCQSICRFFCKMQSNYHVYWNACKIMLMLALTFKWVMEQQLQGTLIKQDTTKQLLAQFKVRYLILSKILLFLNPNSIMSNPLCLEKALPKLMMHYICTYEWSCNLLIDVTKKKYVYFHVQI